MPIRAKLFSLFAMLAVSTQARAADWQLQAAEGTHGVVLTYGSDQPASYRFECAPSEVIVTEIGVTKLLDLKSGKPIGDDQHAVMPSGAAMMALYGGKGDPQFLPAEAAKNPAGGWNLTIRLPKNDRQLKAVDKNEMMSLFTTGYTQAVAMDGGARAKWKDFMQRCNAAR